MKAQLRSFLIAILVLVAAPTMEAQPVLNIAASGHQTILDWSATGNGTNGVLESTHSLNSPNWMMATDTVAVTWHSQPAISVNNTASARFFRLTQVPPTADGMAFIPPGSFTIGDTLDGSTNAVPTNVYVSAFYMDTNLVSYSQWKQVYQWATNHGYAFANAGLGKATNHPAQTVDWYDVIKWSNARSQQAGLTPVYYADPAFTQIYTNGEATVYALWTAKGYRLPTEAEWEKAARAGWVGQRFPWGNTISESQANYIGDTVDYSYDLGPDGYNAAYKVGGTPYTSPVGAFSANAYGLYDMAGNVLEWCWDWYATPPYPAGSPYLGGDDPHGPATGSQRVFRGGAWIFDALDARCAARGSTSPTFNGAAAIGFRCVRGY